jgi:hypothetical protein
MPPAGDSVCDCLWREDSRQVLIVSVSVNVSECKSGVTVRARARAHLCLQISRKMSWRGGVEASRFTPPSPWRTEARESMERRADDGEDAVGEARWLTSMSLSMARKMSPRGISKYTAYSPLPSCKRGASGIWTGGVNESKSHASGQFRVCVCVCLSVCLSVCACVKKCGP